MWIGKEGEVNELFPQSAIEMASNKISFTIERYYKCNVYVHQAKILPAFVKSRLLSNIKLIIFLHGAKEQTKVSIDSLAKKEDIKKSVK